jgi:hypothetical protein
VRELKDVPCPICAFKTNPPHDGRSHRRQGGKADVKKFSQAELEKFGYEKASWPYQSPTRRKRTALRHMFGGRASFVCIGMDWKLLMAAPAAFLFAYGIAPWLMRNTKWRLLWFVAVCALVMACIRYLHPAAMGLVGAASCLGTTARHIKLIQQKQKTAL